MNQPFTYVKYLDEGSSSIFLARLMLGVCEIRDWAIKYISNHTILEEKRLEFDKLHKSVFDALLNCRQNYRNIIGLLDDYIRKVQEGQVVSLKGQTIYVNETIDIQLKQEVKNFYINGVIAFKGTQKVTKFLGVDIGFLYQKQTNFLNSIKDIDIELSTFLKSNREAWSEEFVLIRDDIEHHGWELPDIRFVLRPPMMSPIMKEPQVNGHNLRDYLKYSLNQLISFIENIIMYCFKRVLELPVILEEIPEEQRDKKKTVRFKVNLVSHGIEWNLEHQVSEFV